MTTKPAWHFWVVAVLGLIWNALGCANYIMQLDPARVTTMPEAYQAFLASRPAWATAVFALTVFAGLPGCLLLLARRKQANVAFSASLLGAIGAVVSVLGLDNTSLMVGTGMSLAAAILLLGYASKAHQNGVLR